MRWGAVFTLCSSLVVLPVFIAHAQDDDDVVRVRHANTYELPDGDAFAITLSSLDSLEQEKQGLGESLVRQGMGLSRIEAADFRLRLMEVYESIERETLNRQYDLACIDGTPRFYGEDVYKALEDMDDVEGVVAGERYTALLGSLDPDTAGRLNQWIQDRKLSTTQTKLWKKKSFDRSGYSADAFLAQLCIMFVEESVRPPAAESPQ